MPFVTRCPFCGLQARVPDGALGISLACPRCHDSYTVAPETNLPAAAPRPFPSPTPVGAVTAVAAPPVAPPVAVTAPPVAPVVPSPAPVPVRSVGTLVSPWPDEDEATPGRWRNINVLGLVALQLGALAFVAASFPLTAVLALPLAGVGLVLGLAATLRAVASDKLSPLAITGSALSFLALVLPLLWPGLFRTVPTNRGTAATTPGKIEAVPVGGRIDEAGLVDGAGWADASRAALQQNGLRIQIDGVEVGPLPLKAPAKGQPPPSAALRDRYLLVHMHTLSVGAARAARYHPWGGAEKDDFPPVLTDNLGKQYQQPAFDREVGINGRVLLPTELWPGRSVEELLVFERPAAGVEFLHLELPAAAYGGEGTLRFKIPQSMIRR